MDLKSRRKKLGLTLEEVGQKVGVGKSTVRKWENGYIANMGRDKIVLLAQALQINPLDVLDPTGNLTRSTIKSTQNNINLLEEHSPQSINNKQFFSNQLRKLLDETGKKQIDLHNDLNIPKSTITGYIKGTSIPTTKNIQKIADYFGVSRSEIDLRFNDKVLEIISTYSKLDDRHKMIVYSFVKNQLKKQDLNKKG